MKVTKLPGTTMDIPASDYSVRDIINSMFLAGGLVLSQVSSLTGLPAHVLQNWVKRKFVSSPIQKKYTKNQFCKIVIINFLKEGMQLDIISKLVDGMNQGHEGEEEDNIDEYELYCTFVEIILLTDLDFNQLEHSVDKVIDNHDKAHLRWNKKGKLIFRIMGTIFISSQMKLRADYMVEELNL